MRVDASQAQTSIKPIQEDLHRLLNIQEIYYEPDILNYDRGVELLNQYPEATRQEVASHWNIPDLHGNEGAVEDWNREDKKSNQLDNL